MIPATDGLMSGMNTTTPTGRPDTFVSMLASSASGMAKGFTDGGTLGWGDCPGVMRGLPPKMWNPRRN